MAGNLKLSETTWLLYSLLKGTCSANDHGMKARLWSRTEYHDTCHSGDICELNHINQPNGPHRSAYKLTTAIAVVHFESSMTRH